MHILLIHQAFAAINEPGGTRHHELALHLARNGHQITIIASPVSYLTGKSSDSDYTNTGSDHIKILRPPVYAALHRSFVHRVLNFLSFMVSSFWIGLQIKDVDLVWGTSPPIFQGITAWMLARLKKIPFLFEVRDLWPAFAIAVGVLKNKVLIRASEGLEGFLYRSANQVVINSPGFADHVTKHGAKAVKLVPNGSDVSMFDPENDGSGFRREHQLEGKYVALYAGAHGMSNDLDVVIEAAGCLQTVENLAIVLLGDGKEKSGLQQRANERGLKNVYFLPPVPKNRMVEALAAADVCIAILRPIEMYKTVYPNKVFDYMAAGRPVILAIEGVIKDVVESAHAGTAVPPGNPESLVAAILYYMENRESGQIQGQNGRRYIENNFDRVALADQMLEIMHNMAPHAP